MKKADREFSVLQVANYIVKTGCTVRAAALVFGISKSTVYKYVADEIKLYDLSLALQVRTVLDRNKAERHIRGGMATRKNKIWKKLKED